MSDKATHLSLRPIEDKDEISAFMTRTWGSPRMMVGLQVYDVAAIEATGLYAEDKTLLAFASWALRDKIAYLCVLHAFAEGSGHATHLLAALKTVMKEAGARSIRAMTTNDNMPALIFYQNNGFRLSTLYAGGVDAYRPVMPGMNTHGYMGIPIRDAIELEIML